MVSTTGGAPRAVIIGGGMIAAVHRKSLQALGIPVIGVLDATAEGGRALAEQWDVPTAFLSIDEVVQSEADMVHICAPNSTHVLYARTLLNAGKNVICEKPLATSLEDAEELAALAEEKGVVATVPYIYRYYSVVREIRARVREGDLGSLYLMHGSYLQDWLLHPLASNWRIFSKTGGPSRAFADIGSHWCDLVEWVSGQRIESLIAQTSVSIPRRPVPASTTFSASNGVGTSDHELVPVDTEDTATLLFRTAEGVPGMTAISQVSAGRKNRLWFEIDGAKGSATFNQEIPDVARLADEYGDVSVHQRGAHTRDRTESLGPGHPQGWEGAFEAFIKDTYAALEGRHSSALPTFADGARSVRLVDAVLKSAGTRTWTEIGK